MAIVNAQLKTTALDILDPIGGAGVPAGKSYAITNIMVCNTGDTNGALFVAEPDIGASLTNLAATVSYLEV